MNMNDSTHIPEEQIDEQAQEQEVDAARVEQPAQVDPQEEAFKTQFMRVSADFANYKRRVEKERTQWIRTGQSAIIEAFLPVIDDVERALSATKAALDEHESDGLAQAVEGFELVQKNILKVLEELGVQEITCDGAFDPHHHEALMQADSDQHETGQIVQVLSKGYTYKDAVIRHAKVSVAK